MDNENELSGNIIVGLLLIVSGISISIVALQMKVFRDFLDAPGFFPLILGCIFVLLGAVLSIPALRQSGFTPVKNMFAKSNLILFVKNDKTLRVTVLLAMMFVYVFILIGRMHFAIATAIYLFATMLFLKSTKWWLALIISIVASVCIAVVFRYGFRIPLPR